jgi:hypothetical protein
LLAFWAGCFLSLGQPALIDRVRFLPDQPQPYQLRNWPETAKDANSIFFDLTRKGDYLPVVWMPDKKSFGMPSYVGNEEIRGKTGEAICQLGALLGSTADKLPLNEGGVNWLSLSSQFYVPKEGLVLNNVGATSDSSFWYVLLPSLDYVQLSLAHPDWVRGRQISQTIADTWARGIDELGANFDHTAYNFVTKKPLDNKLWVEPDAAAGAAYLELCEALRSGASKYWQASGKALGAMEKRTTNPTYEVLTPYGALTAAYLNAAKGQNWDMNRFVNWCFEPTAPQRPGWGMIVGKWGGQDVGGLMGSVNDGGGYAFAMNTYLDAANLAPVARYDARFSHDIAKWLLNVANSSRFFYGDSVAADHQSSPNWKGDPGRGLAYEGVRRTWEGKDLYVTGDAVRGNGAKTDIGLYGSGYVGLLAALVHPTNVPMILRLDLRATDFLPVKAYPTDLYWNPYAEAKTVSVKLGSAPVRLYDAVSHQFLAAHPVSGFYPLSLRPDQAVQIVQVPASGAVSFDGRVTSVEGVPIDYGNGRVPRPKHAVVVPEDLSVAVQVGKASLDSAGNVKWDQVSSDRVTLQSGKMRAALRFAWDDQYLYFDVTQTAPATETIEAPTGKELGRHWWDFEDVVLTLDPGRGITSVADVPEITLGWSSKGQTDLVLCPQLNPDEVQVATTGQARYANRNISGRVLWSALDRVYGFTAPSDHLPVAGAKLGCQPLIVDGTFNRQAYIGGARYAKPSGYDQNSRTLVLAGG